MIIASHHITHIISPKLFAEFRFIELLEHCVCVHVYLGVFLVFVFNFSRPRFRAQSLFASEWTGVLVRIDVPQKQKSGAREHH